MARQRKYKHKHKYPKGHSGRMHYEPPKIELQMGKWLGAFFIVLIAVTIYLTPGG